MTRDQPFLPLFFGDFLASTAEWEGEERSLYLLCLGHQWELGTLPADLRKLRKLVDYDAESFDRWWPTVSLKFIPMGTGRIGNPRLEEHRAKALQIARRKVYAGKAGAAARWGTDGKTDDKPECESDDKPMAAAWQPHSTGNASANASAIQTDSTGNGTRNGTANSTGMQNGWQPHVSANASIPSHPIPSQSNPNGSDVSNHLQTKSSVQKPKNARANLNATEELARARATEGLNLEAWERWLEYRAERKPAVKPVSAVAAAKELARYGPQQMAVVNQSIANQWQGLFALKGNGNAQHSNTKAWTRPKSAEEQDTEIVRAALMAGKSDQEISEALDEMRSAEWIANKRRELEPELQHAQH